MASDTSLIQLIIQYGIGPTMVIALMLTGWLVPRRHQEDTNKRGDEWKALYEYERDVGDRYRNETRQIMAEVSGTLAGFGKTLDLLIAERDDNRKFREQVLQWMRQSDKREHER